MAQVEITIGGRVFDVACQDGEEHFLHAAASMLDREAAHLNTQIGRMPEARMLLMAGLMLADKTAGLEDKLRELNSEADKMRSRIAELQAQPAPEPERVEVPVIPTEVTESLTKIATRTEALADQISVD